LLRLSGKTGLYQNTHRTIISNQETKAFSVAVLLGYQEIAGADHLD